MLKRPIAPTMILQKYKCILIFFVPRRMTANISVPMIISVFIYLYVNTA